MFPFQKSIRKPDFVNKKFILCLDCSSPCCFIWKYYMNVCKYTVNEELQKTCCDLKFCCLDGGLKYSVCSMMNVQMFLLPMNTTMLCEVTCNSVLQFCALLLDVILAVNHIQEENTVLYGGGRNKNLIFPNRVLIQYFFSTKVCEQQIETICLPSRNLSQRIITFARLLKIHASLKNDVLDP